jgi:hypothetical protein
MQEHRQQPSIVAFNMLITAFPSFKQAEALMCKVIESGIAPNIHTYTALFMNAATSDPLPPASNASFWLGDMLQRHIKPDTKALAHFEKWTGGELAEKNYAQYKMENTAVHALNTAMEKLSPGLASRPVERAPERCYSSKGPVHELNLANGMAPPLGGSHKHTRTIVVGEITPNPNPRRKLKTSTLGWQDAQVESVESVVSTDDEPDSMC